LQPGVEARSLHGFFVQLLAAIDDPSKADDLSVGTAGVSLRKVAGVTRQGTGAETQGVSALRVFISLQLLAGEYVHYAQERANPPTISIRRVLQRIVDYFQRRGDFMIALAQVGRYDEGLAGHIARSSVMAAGLGKALRLERRLVGQAALAVFTSRAPLAMLGGVWNAPRPGQAKEAYETAFSKVLSGPGLGGVGATRTLVSLHEGMAAIEGQAHPYGSGLKASLAGRIASVATFYDHIRANLEEGDRSRPISPVETMDRIKSLAQGGRLPGEIDPELIGPLSRLMGDLPPGTLVKMDNGAFGMVRDRPAVVQLTDTFGRYLEEFRETQVPQGLPLNPPLGLNLGLAFGFGED